MRFIALLLVLFSTSALSSVDLTHRLAIGTSWSNTTGASVTHGKTNSQELNIVGDHGRYAFDSEGWDVDNTGDVDGLTYTSISDSYRIKDDYASGESGSYINTSIGHNGLTAEQNTSEFTGYSEGERKVTGESVSYALTLSKAESSNGGAENGVSYKRVIATQDTTYSSITEYGGTYSGQENHSGLR